MLESPTHLRKRTYSTCIKKTKEEQEKDLIGLPRHIGPYELVEKLKDGGYSKIYKAKSNYTGDFVAIKSIEKLCFQESAEDVLLMVRQAEVLKILKHRNLVNLYEIYESQKYFYMIMDYIPNGDLIEQIIKKKRFPEQEALVIFSQLVDALYYMHKNEICHRDIRTEKILFDKKNQPKLVGFSYSSFYTKGKKIRDSYGSLCYACPEIIQNDYYNPELADVWSLGVVLYVMVCGYLPFSEDDDDENKYLIINGKVDYPPQISNKVKDLLKHMLDIDPNKRYTFQKILRHPWFKPFDESALTGGCNPYKMIYPVDERILKLVVIYGFNKKEVDKDLKQNTFNCRTGLYKQLTDKLLYMGFTSLSDLCSDDFMKFSRDQENIISDGEAKYKKYINKILERIKKVERYVNDYKRKEDKIIKDLENIYSDAVKEENKNIKTSKNDKISKNKQYKNLKSENDMNKIINNKEKISKTKRKTVSPYEMIKEQKVINKIYKNEIKNKIEDNGEDFDVLKEFHKQNKLKESENNKNSSIFSLEESDFDINNSKIKRTKSNPNIKDFVQNLIEKDDRNRDLYELDSLYEDNLNLIRNSKRKRQLSVMIKRKKRNYLNAGSENDYFLKRPKDKAERKKIIADNYKKSIKNIIIEENINEEKDREEQNKDSDDDNNLGINLDNDKNEKKENNDKKGKKIVESKRKKSLRFSLSFGDDDDDEEEEDENDNDNSSISKIESKRVSMYDIDEEIKELKEIKNTIKSPLRSSFLKRNTNDNNLINFNMESNSSIFGEHLEEETHRKNSNAAFLESVNEKYDLLTELKRLSDNANRKKKNPKIEEKDKINENEENKEFIYDSFGESKNENEKEKEYSNFEKEENKENSLNYKNYSNLIVFDDKLEISFHDEKSDINTESQKDIIFVNPNSKVKNSSNKKNEIGIKKYMIYSNDRKKISKLNPVNQLEDILFNIQNINSRRQKLYNLKFKKDIFTIRKLNIINNDICIIDIISKTSKIKKLKNSENKNQGNELNNNLKKENKKNYNNKEKYKYKSDTKNSKNKKSNHNKSQLINNDFNRENIYNINYLLSDKNNNIINFYNQNDNYNQKIYIFDNSQNIQNSTTNEIKSIKNDLHNNIVVNSNNNTINNITIKDKHNYENYYHPEIIIKNGISKERKVPKLNKINYTIYEDNLSKSKINTKLSKDDKNSTINSTLKKENKLSNTFKPNKKMELYLLYSEKLKSTKKKNKHPAKSNEISITNKTHKSNKYNFSISIDNKNLQNNYNILDIQKNLNDKFKNMSTPFNQKEHKESISIEKAFHYTIINDETELLEDPKGFISKIKKGKKLKKLLADEKTSNKKNVKFYNKFVNKNSSNPTNKSNLNYSEIYLKKLYFNKNDLNTNL